MSFGRRHLFYREPETATADLGDCLCSLGLHLEDVLADAVGQDACRSASALSWFGGHNAVSFRSHDSVHHRWLVDIRLESTVCSLHLSIRSTLRSPHGCVPDTPQGQN